MQNKQFSPTGYDNNGKSGGCNQCASCKYNLSEGSSDYPYMQCDIGYYSTNRYFTDGNESDYKKCDQVKL
ncbi:hypothetical protein TTHERM_00531820 (macronuclear) [Tetrahymena thermophila SB210]|uniref:Uncharacterized protein n=1 Tax=Tetrahymena thermophila (strain SB210) TaxID=312017 RepID=Q248I3_TETTS|nr:hypothetical protein TTHERM_00531820 [Tetrahymena thermophila SB210]EAS04062.2 hypothetical protein TTHERM_00531820 [Tetrahymena thermophila SB210]|eukprot:XP_001024307.2 hypothetical protein TTHERM_00531820 [Tetrahymena thermophila SB210]